jgi:hypothetical protein
MSVRVSEYYNVDGLYCDCENIIGNAQNTPNTLVSLYIIEKIVLMRNDV